MFMNTDILEHFLNITFEKYTMLQHKKLLLWLLLLYTMSLDTVTAINALTHCKIYVYHHNYLYINNDTCFIVVQKI